MRTKLGICLKKARYDSEEDAWTVIRRADIVLRPYRCELCRKYHLTSRTKGKRIRPAVVDGGPREPSVTEGPHTARIMSNI